MRLCKGIYAEPPELAFPDFDAVRANFVEALDALLDANAYVGIATHDEWLIQRGLERVHGLAREAYEFQMLLGVRPGRAEELVAEGHRLRVYVPFGREWYQYSLRRLQENPKVAGYIAGDTLGRLLGSWPRGYGAGFTACRRNSPGTRESCRRWPVARAGYSSSARTVSPARASAVTTCPSRQSRMSSAK